MILKRIKLKWLQIWSWIFLLKDGRKFLSNLKNQTIFLDLKLNDIPNTIKSALKSLKDLKISYMTVHLSSGFSALKTL